MTNIIQFPVSRIVRTFAPVEEIVVPVEEIEEPLHHYGPNPREGKNYRGATENKS